MGEWRRSELGHGVRSSEFGCLAAQLRAVSWRELGVLEGKVKNFRGKGEVCYEAVGSREC